MTHGQAYDDRADRTLLARLSLEEKVSLLSGQEFWSLPSLPKIGLDAIVTSDGPTGVKCAGDTPIRSPVVPCGTALAATWNPDLVEDVASLLGEAARLNGVHVLLAPATNMLRSPLSGRNFEYYSEDPLLAATMTGAYVRGVQREGVAATVKHFVCHDAETGRMHGSVEIDEQTLREIYLLPFELAVRDEGAWAVMCSYNKLRGTYMSEHPLLDDLLRGEWGFTGVVVSDWGAVHDTVPSACSGLDVEMPGPPIFRGGNLVAAVRSGDVPEEKVDEKVLRILRLARRTGALGDSRPDRRARRPPFEVATTLRRAAAESFVLLKNDGDLLPLAESLRIAVIGRLAALQPLQGGGSSNVGPIAAPSPLEGIRTLAGDVVYEPGYVASAIPRLDLAWLDGSFTVAFHAADDPDGPPIETQTHRNARLIFREVVAGRPLGELVARVRATLRPPVDGEYVFGLNCSGTGTLRIGGEQVLELGPDHNLDWSYLYRPDSRGVATVTLERGKPVPFELDFRSTPGPNDEIGLITVRAQPPEPADLLERAVQAAHDADVAVVFVGLGEEHECEGFDRESLELPREQQELITAVARVNPRTVVVLSAGAPVLLDCAKRVSAVLLVWYGGQELASALAEVLLGRSEPGGRLPVTFPALPQDAVVLDPAPDDAVAAAWHYREGLFIGYRHFDRHALEPAYCFGHGLGYTHFSYEQLHVEQGGGGDVGVTVRIRNTGERRGKEVVQVYVASGDETRPQRELKAFRCIELEAGAEGELAFTLGERTFSHWDREAGAFSVIPGRHEIAVGRSSRDLLLTDSVTFSTERGEIARGFDGARGATGRSVTTTDR
jgi:beta-glucosidase